MANFIGPVYRISVAAGSAICCMRSVVMSSIEKKARNRFAVINFVDGCRNVNTPHDLRKIDRVT
jgi:GTP:adenosylcobinamide-phosphate guanylyltransferase